jgi:hypothetical protein
LYEIPYNKLSSVRQLLAFVRLCYLNGADDDPDAASESSEAEEEEVQVRAGLGRIVALH